MHGWIRITWRNDHDFLYIRRHHPLSNLRWTDARIIAFALHSRICKAFLNGREVVSASLDSRSDGHAKCHWEYKSQIGGGPANDA